MMKRFNDDFLKRLDGFDFKVLEQSKNSICALSKDLKFIYFNPAMYEMESQLSLKNTSDRRFRLGGSVLNTFKGFRLKYHLKRQFKNVLKTGKAWKHELVCPKNIENNTFLQCVYPLHDGDGLLLITTEIYKLPLLNLSKKVFDFIEKRYIQPTGQIVICPNCRHTKRADENELWDWVPNWVDNLPVNGSLAICPTCASLCEEEELNELYEEISL